MKLNVGTIKSNMAAPLYSVIARLRNELNDVSVVSMPSAIETILRKNQFLTTFNMVALHAVNFTPKNIALISPLPMLVSAFEKMFADTQEKQK